MALETIRSLIPYSLNDLVGIFTQDFNQVFIRARPIKASVKEDAKLMEHPLETGATITDHRIILPVEIELSMIMQAVDYRDTYEDIKQAFLNATLLVVQTKTGIYSNMLIQSLPHEEDPEFYDAVPIALKLKEVLFAIPQRNLSPRSPQDSSTVDRGNQQPTTESSVAFNSGYFRP